MAYTFGGAAGDDAGFGYVHSMWANTQHALIAGWWLPTTLTAGRKLLGGTSGALKALEVDTTTSEIRIKHDYSTTVGEWTTTGVGLTVDEWRFIAVLSATGNAGSEFRVWSGTIDTPPAECTVTLQVAPSGTISSSSSFTLGNAGSSGTVAWQGDIGGMFVVTDGSTSEKASMLMMASNTTISNTEADRIYKMFVVPIWLGNPFSPAGGIYRRVTSSGDGMTVLDLSKTSPAMPFHTTQNATFSPLAIGFTGPTKSQNRWPRPIWNSQCMHPNVVRR